MNPKKIKPILSSHVSIHEMEDSQLFYKKYHKFVTSFALDNKQTDPFGRYYYSSSPPFSYVKKSKYTKSVQRFRLSVRYDEDYDGDDISYNSSFVKMFPNVKCLLMQNCSISENCLIGSLAIWLKVAKRIRKINCQDHVDTFENYEDYEDKKHSKQFVRVFRKGKLEELNVYGEYPDLFAEYAYQFPMINQLRYISSNYIDERISKPYYVRKIWFRWNYEEHWRINPKDQYRTKLIEIAMCWSFTNEIPQVSPVLLGEIVHMWQPWNKIRSELLSSITDMSNLTSLDIDFPIESNLIKKLLEYFPDLLNLAFLKIKDSSDERLGEFDLCPQLLEIQSKLKTLKLDFKDSDEPIKYLANFPKNHALKQLHLTLPIKNETELETLINLTRHLQEAEVLCLCIPNSHVWFHDGFYILLEKIFALEKLRRIQFEWVHNDDETAKKVKEYDAKNEIHFDSGSSLDKLLTKQPPLEVFKLNFVLRNANERTSLLMNVLERGHWLRELELDVGKFQLNKGDFDVIVSLLKNLQQIEILKLEGFSFNAESKLGALIKEIRCYQKIKSLNLGEIISVSLEFLLEIVISILLIPTIKTFNCSISTSLLATLRDNEEMKRRFRYCSKFGYVNFDETSGSMKWKKVEFYEGYRSRTGQGRGIDVTKGRVGWSGNWRICKIPWPEDE